MAALTESQIYESEIYAWETSDPVLAGPGGIMRTPLQQLANRTNWLKGAADKAAQRTISIVTGVGGTSAVFTDEAQGRFYTATSAASALTITLPSNDPTPLTMGAIIAIQSSVNSTTVLTVAGDLRGSTKGDLQSIGLNAGDRVLLGWMGSYWLILVDSRQAATTPIGSILAFGGATPPVGWMICNGAKLKRLEYPQLFGVIGTSFATSTGPDADPPVTVDADEFRIPELRGEFIRGLDNGREADDDIGRVLGSYQGDALKVHSHFYQAQTDPDGGVGPVPPAGQQSAQDPFSTFLNPINGLNTSGGGYSIPAHFSQRETRPRNVALNYIIKVGDKVVPASGGGGGVDPGDGGGGTS